MRTPTLNDQQVGVVALFTDISFGYERWVADQVGSAKGHDERWGVLLLFPNEEERNAWLTAHGGER